MSDLIKKLEAFRANLVGEDMNYRACLVDEAISRIRGLERDATYPYPHCRQKAVCAGKGSCPLDPTCGD